MNSAQIAFTASVFAGGLFVYLFPTAIAWIRRHRQLPAIAALNLLLGWTLLGWIAALVWAFVRPHQVDVIPRRRHAN